MRSARSRCMSLQTTEKQSTPHPRAVVGPAIAGRPLTGSVLGSSRGFTLLELMIVISIILILMAVAVPDYNQSICGRANRCCGQNLFTLRSVISQYTLDKQKAPQSLDDLVTAGYLRQIPSIP